MPRPPVVTRSPVVDRRLARGARAAGLLLAEAPRSALELGATSALAPLLAADRRGDGHAVLVVPGLGQRDASTLLLRRYLRWLGYSVSGWRLGANLGSSEAVVSGLRSRLASLAETSGGPVSIVGWSLGGVYAHELARRTPGSVRQVVTLGSPVHARGRPGRTVSAVFDQAARLHLAPPVAPRVWQEAGPLRVPATSVYSRTDGIVPWRTCRLRPAKRRENVEVLGSHLGLVHNPSVLHLLADRLAQPADGWRPFSPGLLLRPAYPS